MIYLDSAATTLQKPPAVAQATAAAIGTLASPGRGGHGPAMKAADVAYRCREAAAELFGVSDPGRVVFTLNATHALNLAIKSVVKPGDRVLVSGYEHNAVTRPLITIEDVIVKPVVGGLFDGRGSIRAFDLALTQDVSCVVCNHVSNVFGCVQPMEELAALCAQRGIPLIVDASQSAGCFPIHLERWKAQFIAMPGHKGLYGPQGTGLLLCGASVPTTPLLAGGTGSASLRQEMPGFLPDRLEAGTHNITGIAGLLEGLRFVKSRGIKSILCHEQALVTLMAQLLNQIPGVETFAPPSGTQHGGVLSFRLAGMDCEEVGMRLGDRGIAVRAGLHCAPLAHQSVGTVETGTVRASVSIFNRSREIVRFAEEMERIARFLKYKTNAGC